MQQDLEKGAMDKKNNNRQLFLTTKTGDVKKAAQFNQKARGPRRRECDVSDRSSKMDSASRRYAQPRIFPDKRPRARTESSEPRAQVTKASGPDLYSVQRPGTRKSNMNHLLNFHYTPLGGAQKQHDGQRFAHGHRSCQFLVRDDEDYSKHATDPDLLVDWDCVEQVRMQVTTAPDCPICLYPPVCARVTRCAHIYCASCILHYLSLAEERTWRSCPICHEAVHERDLKSVKTVETATFSVGDKITMRLMKRERGSTYAMPAEEWSDRQGAPHKDTDDEFDLRVCKLLTATNARVLDLIESERDQLRTLLAVEDDSLTTSFIERALELLQEREDLVLKKPIETVEEEEDKHAVETDEGWQSIAVSEAQKPTVCYTDAFDDIVAEEKEPEDDDALEVFMAACNMESADTSPRTSESSSHSANDGECANSSNFDHDVTEVEPLKRSLSSDTGDGTVTSSVDKGKFYYFYQASDGQHIYLHSVNARCLVREYGSLACAPRTITAELVELDSLSMTEDLRNRLRYLGHLPRTCEFRVAELRLTPPCVSTQTLRTFARDLELRAKLRRQKLREEKRHSRKVAQHLNEEARKSGILREGFVIQKSRMREEIEPSDFPDITESSTGPDSPPVAAADGGHLSFAQMLRSTPLQFASSPPTSGVAARAVLMTSPRASAAHSGLDTAGEDGEEAAAPEYHEAFGDAIDKAMEKIMEEGQEMDKTKSSDGGKKKKKQKNRLLFATNMARAK